MLLGSAMPCKPPTNMSPITTLAGLGCMAHCLQVARRRDANGHVRKLRPQSDTCKLLNTGLLSCNV